MACNIRINVNIDTAPQVLLSAQSNTAWPTRGNGWGRSSRSGAEAEEVRVALLLETGLLTPADADLVRTHVPWTICLGLDMDLAVHEKKLRITTVQLQQIWKPCGCARTALRGLDCRLPDPRTHRKAGQARAFADHHELRVGEPDHHLPTPRHRRPRPPPRSLEAPLGDVLHK